jgi:hypothetical protein
MLTDDRYHTMGYDGVGSTPGAFDLLELDWAGAAQLTRYVGADGMVYACANNVLRSSNNLSDTTAWSAASGSTVLTANTIDFQSDNQGVFQNLVGTSNRFLGKAGETLSYSFEIEVLSMTQAGNLSLRYANLSGSEVTTRSNYQVTAVGQRVKLFMTFTPSGTPTPRLWIQNRTDVGTAFRGKVRVHDLCLSVGTRTFPYVQTTTTGAVYKYRSSRNLRGWNGTVWTSSKIVELNSGEADMRMLVEGVAQTNLVTNHSTSNWTGTRATLAASVGTDPAGATNAYTLTESVDAGTHLASFAVTLAESTVYTASVFLRSSTRHVRVLLQRKDGQYGYVTLDPSTATVGTSANANNIKLRALANNWVRLSFDVDTLTGVSATIVAVQLISTDGVTASYTGDGVSNVECWGAGVAAQNYATHPVLTHGSSVTRAAEAPTSTALAGISTTGRGVLEATYVSRLSGTGINQMVGLYGASAYVRIIDRNSDGDGDRYSGSEINDGTTTTSLNVGETLAVNTRTATVVSWDPIGSLFAGASDDGSAQVSEDAAPAIDTDLGATARIGHHSSGAAASVAAFAQLRYVPNSTLTESACAARAATLVA